MNSSNSTGEYCKYYVPESDTTRTVKVIAITLLSVYGIFGNIFVIVLAALYTVRKNLHHLIINMAVSDTLVILLITFYHVPHTSNLTFSLYPFGIVGDILCKASMFLLHVSYTESLVTLLIISIERFRATRTTVRISRPYTLKQRVAVLFCSWLIPMTLFANVLYFSRLIEDRGVTLCYIIINRVVSAWLFFIQQTLVVISFCVTVLLSILTLRRLSKPQAIQAHLNQEQRKVRARRIQAAIRMVLFSLLMYACCWLPRYVFFSLISLQLLIKETIFIDYSLCIDRNSLIFMILYFLPLVNSCFSPYIYIIFLSDFREATKRLVCRKTNRHVNRRNSVELQPIQNQE